MVTSLVVVNVTNGYWRRYSGERNCPRSVVTVRVEGMTFLRPVAVGDVCAAMHAVSRKGRHQSALILSVGEKSGV